MIARAPTHVGYAVDDLEAAARWWASAQGAGPFLALPPSAYDEVVHDGGPARLEHRLAFGQWGGIMVELQHTTVVEPEPLAALLTPRGGGVNHVSYLVADLAAERERLEEHGLSQVLAARSGPIELAYFSAPGLGHAVEILRDNEILTGFYADVAAAARDWDGSEPLREVS